MEIVDKRIEALGVGVVFEIQFAGGAMTIRGDLDQSAGGRRYWKFSWSDLSGLPAVGKLDYQPKGGALRLFEEGTFRGESLESFPAIKVRKNLKRLGSCAFCSRENDKNGNPLKLTDEHVIPEFLGAGLQLPAATCSDCQRVTAEFESALAREMFDPVRKAFRLQGKRGVPEPNIFPLDVGRETTEHEFIPISFYPTMLVMPMLFPAYSYSHRPDGSDDPLNFQMYNINASASFLKKFDVTQHSSQALDLVRFSQMIAKIALVYAAHYYRDDPFISSVADFVRTDYPKGAPCTSHFAHVGCLWRSKQNATSNLHEIEVGTIEWSGRTMRAVRVRLFASYGMPSYYVTVADC